MFGFVKKLFDSNEKQLNKLQTVVEEINGLEGKISKLSTEDMQKKLREHKADIHELMKKVPKEDLSSIKVRDYKEDLPSYEQDIVAKLQEILPEVFAIIREVTKRKFDRRHYDVQLLAGIVLAQGNKLTENKTG